jgi:hypothetical protein
MVMTPLEIKLMLHFYAVAEPYNGPEAGRAVYAEIVTYFMSLGLIEPCKHGHHTTEGGVVYVKALMAVPLPVQQWVIPEVKGPPE